MKMRSGLACLVAAVAAVSFGSQSYGQVALTFDADPNAAGVQDGNGTWDLSNTSWLNAGVNGSWIQGSDAIFGTAPTGTNAAVSLLVDLGSNITVRDMTFNNAADGSVYSISDFGGALTLNGNVTKAANSGTVQFFVPNNGVNLGTGQHVFTVRDSPGDDAPEMRLDGDIKGAGGVTLDNGTFESWGTLSMSGNNSYAGQTLISKGRLAITNSSALGSTAGNTVISNGGTLSIGSNNNVPVSSLTINEPIVIQRSLYAGGDATDAGLYAHYPAAIVTANGSGTTTFTGTLTVDSTDARIRANSSTMVIANPITVTGADRRLVIDGDFAGFVRLAAANPALATNGVTIMGGGTLLVDNDAQIGGGTSPINMSGGYIRFVDGYATTFGSHVVNTTTFNGGVDVDAGKTFTIAENLTGVSLGMRGTGTLNINGNNVLTGLSYYDNGVVNVNASHSIGGLRLRRATMNVGSGAVLTTTNAVTSIAMDSMENATLNITGTGRVLANPALDFNVSDQANTTGTLNISDSAELSTSGTTWVGKTNGSVGTINQSGNSVVNIRRTGDFSLVLGGRRGTGIYNMTGGTLNIAGEFYVGQGNGGLVDPQGVGIFDQSGGTVTVNSSFVLGREGAGGTATIRNGALFIKQGINNLNIDGGAIAGGAPTPSVLTVDNATLRVSTGELRVGSDTGTNGTLNVINNATVTVNNWLSVGRTGATGTLNLDSGTITKAGTNNVYVGESANQASVMNIRGGALLVNNGEFWLGNAGSSKGTLNLSAGSLTVNSWIAVGRNGTASGELNMTGGTLTKNTSGTSRFVIGSGATASGVVNQSGGTINSVLTSVGESGTGTANLSGGIANLGDLIVKATGPSGTLNVSGTAAVSAVALTMGLSGAGTSTVALSGGSLTATSIAPGAGTGSKTFTWSGGRLSTGSYSLTSDLANAGTGLLSPGGTGVVGTTAITAGYTQASTASMAIDISSGSLFDTITAGAASVINGTISVDVLGSFSPAGLSFDIFTLTAGALTGTPTLTGPDAGLFTLSIVGGNTLRLSAGGSNPPVPGDYNRDGYVDAADYTVWADSFGQTGTGLPADGNNDSVVDAADYTIWADNFGQGTPPSGVAGAVPEPTALALVPALLPMLARRRRV